MKIILSITTVVLLLSLCAKKVVKPEASIKELKILTYNIHHANPPTKYGVIEIDAVVNAIKKEDPDVVAMQELDNMVNRSGNIDETKLIAQKLGMNYRFYKSIDYDGGEYGIAIFSKYDLKNSKQIILPKKVETSETRSLAYVDIIVNHQKITIACTHLDVESEDSRVMQVKAIQNELNKISHPIILCGDFNSSEGAEAITVLLQQYKNSCTNNCGFTVPAVNPRRNIDFIVTKNASWEVKDYHVVDETYASDHRPVAATFMLKSN